MCVHFGSETVYNKKKKRKREGEREKKKVINRLTIRRAVKDKPTDTKCCSVRRGYDKKTKKQNKTKYVFGPQN